MLNRNVNPMELSFANMERLMRAKAEVTIAHAIAGIECHVEQLEEDVFSDRPTYGCNIGERVARHNKVKTILTDKNSVWATTAHGLMTRIYNARVAVADMLMDINEERKRLEGLIGQDPPTLDELTVDESVRELKCIADNLINGPEDPDYADVA